MKKEMELPEWNGKFPKRYNCQNPYTKCEFCCHEEPCVPDYADEFRKESELSSVDKFTIAFWLTAIIIAVTRMLSMKF